MFTDIFKGVFLWLGIPRVSIDQLLNYEEAPCMCGKLECQGVRARIQMELHVVKRGDGKFAAEPVHQKSKLFGAG